MKSTKLAGQTPHYCGGLPTNYVMPNKPSEITLLTPRQALAEQRGLLPPKPTAPEPAEPRPKRFRVVSIPYKSRTHEHEGLHLTVREWSQRSGIPASRFHSRMHKGETLAEILAIPKKPRPARTPITHNGLTLTTPEWEAIVNIKAQTIECRMRAGATAKEALTWPLNKRGPWKNR